MALYNQRCAVRRIPKRYFIRLGERGAKYSYTRNVKVNELWTAKENRKQTKQPACAYSYIYKNMYTYTGAYIYDFTGLQVGVCIKYARSLNAFILFWKCCPWRFMAIKNEKKMLKNAASIQASREMNYWKKEYSKVWAVAYLQRKMMLWIAKNEKFLAYRVRARRQ